MRSRKSMDIDIKQASTETLIELALNEDDDLLVNNCIYTLCSRGDNKVLERAIKLCQSNKVAEKHLGIEILGQLGIPERTFPDESLNTLLDLLQTENNPEILCSVGIALGNLYDPRVIQPLIKFKNHPHADVRYGVVSGLLTHEDKNAIDSLIELSSDTDEDVRNWATFGLGSQIEVNTNTIKEALWKRVREEDKNTDIGYEIYGEALVGLARRKDTEVIPILLAELQSDCVRMLIVEAAEEMGEPKLYPALIELKEWWDRDLYLLDRAINNCRPKIH